MSILARRQNTLLPSLNSAPSFGASYTVTAYEAGAVVASAGSATPITVDEGHGLAQNDKFIVGTDTAKYREITSATSATSVPYAGSGISVAVGDYLVNLGVDTGVATPNYDASGRTIYSDPDGGTTITESRVTADAAGNYGYWHKGQEIWELVRDSAGTPVLVIPVVDGLGSRITHLGRGTALTSSDFNNPASSGWGTGAGLSAISGTDSAFRVTVTTGTGPSPNPTLTLTFADGTWGVAPVAQINLMGGTGTLTHPIWTTTALGITITYPGTPLNTETFVFVGHVLGI